MNGWEKFALMIRNCMVEGIDVHIRWEPRVRAFSVSLQNASVNWNFFIRGEKVEQDDWYEALDNFEFARRQIH